MVVAQRKELAKFAVILGNTQCNQLFPHCKQDLGMQVRLNRLLTNKDQCGNGV